MQYEQIKEVTKANGPVLLILVLNLLETKILAIKSKSNDTTIIRNVLKAPIGSSTNRTE